MRCSVNISSLGRGCFWSERGRVFTRTTCGLLGMLLLLGTGSDVLWAQQTSVLDDQIDQIRTMQGIGVGDQGRIAQWVEAQVEALEQVDATDHAAFKGFLDRFDAQYTNPRNTGQFAAQLAIQTTQVAIDKFGKADLKRPVARALALILVKMNRSEVVGGLIAGLKSNAAAPRALCARGLATLRASIATENSRLNRTIEALRAAGSQEANPVSLSHIYAALAYPGQEALVFDAYMELFDQRLARRRASTVIVDRAEIEAFEYFRIPAVLNALSTDQKAGLVRRLAVFLRLDAQRYQTNNLKYHERDVLERRLDGLEAILSTLVPGTGADVRGELSKGGHDARAALLEQVFLWIGHPETNAAGALNATPWSVPVGAP